MEDYEIIEKDNVLLGDHLINHWLKQIKTDDLGFDRLYIKKVDNHLELGYMKVELLR